MEKLKYPDDFIDRVICGDCLEIMRDIPDNSVDLVLTDPPYNCKKDYGVYKDNKTRANYDDWITALVEEWKRITNNKIVIVLGSQQVRLWWTHLPDAKQIIVPMGAVGNNNVKNLALQYHCVLTTVKSNMWMYDYWNDIRWPGEGYFFNEDRYGHPAMTPLKLMVRCASIFSSEQNIILDPFNGVGTVAVACKQANRHYIGIEINPDYCKIARERLMGVPESLFKGVGV